MTAGESNERKANFVLWFVLFGSIGMYYMVMQLIPAGNDPGNHLELYLGVAAGVLATGSVAARLRRGSAENAASFRQYLLLGSVLAEAAALMGVVVHIVTGWPLSWLFLVLGGAVHLLQFPGV